VQTLSRLNRTHRTADGGAKRMEMLSDNFFSDGPGISAVITALADAFYEAVVGQPTEQ
jgi:hypothetical protein